MPAAAARKTKTPKPEKTRPAKSADVAASTTSKPELSGSLVMISIDALLPSPYQTRKEPAGAWISELMGTLEREGQLTPCLVRRAPRREDGLDTFGLYELIAGHTRKLAAGRLGWPELTCRVVDCDDATAERLVLLDNAKRKDLDAIEQARALANLVANYAAAGKSQRDLSADIGVSQSEISNAVRLLSLPETWQERLITGEITKTQARELLPWVDVPDLWPVMETARANDDGLTFDELLHKSLLDVSRPLAGSWYDENRSRWSVVAFKATPDERTALNCRKVNGVERAFAWQLWESMQHVAEDKAAKKAGKQVEAAEGKVAAGKLDPQKAAEQHNKRLYRWKVAWLQKRISLALDDAEHIGLLPIVLVWFALDGSTRTSQRREIIGSRLGLKMLSEWHCHDPLEIVQTLAAKPDTQRLIQVRETVQCWLTCSAEGNTDVPPPFVEWLASRLGVDIVRNWSLDRDYLDLLTTSQLQELAAEWKLVPPVNKRAELIDWLWTEGAEKPCPKAVRGIKAVSL